MKGSDLIARSNREEPPPTDWVKVVGRALIVLIAGTAVYLGIGNWRASRREGKVAKAWRNSVGSPEEVPSLFPRSEKNEAALEVERLSSALGIDLSPVASERPAPRAEAALERHLLAELARPGSRLSAPPEEAAAFLQAHERDLKTLSSMLAAGQVPVWRLDLTRPEAVEPPPSVSGLVRVQRVLLGYAALLEASFRSYWANEALAAAWSLSEGERLRPELQSQLASIEGSRWTLALVRKVLWDAAGWRGRVGRLNARQALLRSIRYEAWMWQKADERAHGGGPLHTARRLARAAASDGWRAFVEAATKSAVTDGDGQELAARFREALSSWGGPSDAGEAPADPVALARAWKQADRLALEVDLTGKVLAAQDGRIAGTWATSLPGGDASPMQGVLWRYELNAQGEGSIRLERELSWPGLEGADIPLRFSPVR